MIDSIQIPILLKAIDFVFDEGRKILAERRERRMAENNAPKTEEIPAEKEVIPLELEKAKEIKRDLQSSKIEMGIEYSPQIGYPKFLIDCLERIEV